MVNHSHLLPLGYSMTQYSKKEECEKEVREKMSERDRERDREGERQNERDRAYNHHNNVNARGRSYNGKSQKVKGQIMCQRLCFSGKDRLAS